MPTTSRIIVTCCALLTACAPEPSTAPTDQGPSFVISDGAHSGGNEHFYFLPPMVPSPAYDGTFDGTLTPQVRITGPGGFAALLTSTVSPSDELYHVNWNTQGQGLAAGEEYRIAVQVDGTTLGFADVVIGANMSELKNVNTGEYIPLKDGRTLPIKFRIEQGWAPPPPPSGWVSLPSISAPRRWMGAAGVDGRVFVLGGWDGAQAVASVEVFDPQTGEWQPRAPMPTPRLGFGTAVLGGLIYTIGGQTGMLNTTETTIVEVYDPATDTWSTRAPLPAARSFLGAASVGGMVYAVGGQAAGWQIPSVEMYDPGTNAWSTRSPMSIPRAEFGLITVGAKLYAMGGITGNAPWVLSTLEEYDPTLDSWTARSPMPTARFGLGVGAVGARFFVIGGAYDMNIAEAYDPGTNSWTTELPMPTPRKNLGVATAGGQLYAIGGANTTFSVPILDVVEKFVP